MLHRPILEGRYPRFWAAPFREDKPVNRTISSWLAAKSDKYMFWNYLWILTIFYLAFSSSKNHETMNDNHFSNSVTRIYKNNFQSSYFINVCYLIGLQLRTISMIYKKMTFSKMYQKTLFQENFRHFVSFQNIQSSSYKLWS